MAIPTKSIEELIDAYGPHLHFTPPGGWGDKGEVDKLVKTHCCFCGVQCGIKLKVKGNDVVGFEPWEEFPLNKGMLCPKGVKRYLQGRHPDRLLSPLVRTGDGFRPETWENANDTVVDNIQRIQKKYGNDAFAVLSGASLTNEKAYLMGKFARVALKTKNIDYNGRLCMVSAGAANKMAFGIDRAANPWSDIPLAKCIIVAGSNAGECFPILTHYLWEARDNGAKIIVIDPRMTPIGRTADLLLPVRPGRDSALMNGILHVCIKNGWLDEDFIEAHTNGFEAVRRKVEEYTPKVVEEIAGVPAKAIEQAAAWWGESPASILMHARGIEHHTQGTENCLACVNLALATGNMGRPGSGYFTLTGQGNGQGAREHGQRCNQLPGARDIENPEDRRVVAERWGIDEKELPGAGMPSTEMMQAIHDGEIRGLLLICFNPVVSLPDTEFTRTALEKLEFFCVIDFFMSETAHYADIVLPGSTQEEDEGTVTTSEGRVVKINKAVEPPGDAHVDWEIICDIARRLSSFDKFPFQNSEDIFRELRALSRGGLADYYGITYEKIERNMGVFWPCPEKSHPGTPRLYEGGAFYHPDGKAKFHAVDYRPPAEDIDEAYPIILTTGRVVSQFLSGTQTRRIGPLVEQCPEPVVELHPELAAQRGIESGDWVRVESRRNELTLECRVVKSIRPDTIFIPFHWPDKRAANRLTNNALDPISKIPQFKACAVRIHKSRPPAAGESA